MIQPLTIRNERKREKKNRDYNFHDITFIMSFGILFYLKMKKTVNKILGNRNQNNKNFQSLSIKNET
jgi:hypothetical protein